MFKGKSKLEWMKQLTTHVPRDLKLFIIISNLIKLHPTISNVFFFYNLLISNYICPLRDLKLFIIISNLIKLLPTISNVFFYNLLISIFLHFIVILPVMF